MRKFLIVFTVVCVWINQTSAQTQTMVKIDTARKKQAPISNKTTNKADSSNNKAQTEKFVKRDSAYSKLTTNRIEEKHLKTDTAELELKVCDFEKDANAMVLFDQAIIAFGNFNTVIERHKRIKIFNDKGKSEANVRIEYNNKFGAEHILAIIGKTINMNNGKIEYTTLDQNLIYNEHTDKTKDAVVFSMPNVKAGSVIEYAYIWERGFSRNTPDWDFQGDLPTGYSEVNVLMSPALTFSALYRITDAFVKDTVSAQGYGHVWALANVPSFKAEPFMRSEPDSRQSIKLVLSSIQFNGKTSDIAASWSMIGSQIANLKEFNKPYYQIIDDEGLVEKSKALKTSDEKIAFLFNQIKTSMKWNEEKNWLSKDGIKSAWKKKSGSWGEINMILCQLLNKAGVKSYPMLVSSRDNGKMLSNFVDVFQINKLVAYIPVDSAKYFILDASNKFNFYNEIPFDQLNSNGLYLDKEKGKYGLVFMKKDQPIKQITFIDAEIKPDGTMTGIGQINSFSYSKSASLELYKTLEEKKYMDYLRDNDNSLKIKSLKFENKEVDSLPLTQTIEFNLDLPGTDDKYIYFNPNLFTSLHDNPFIRENRASDIDFGSVNIFAINGRYKIPAGYKVEALPGSMNLLMPDKSISFKRLLAAEDGFITVHYVISYKKSTYPQSDYPIIRAYFKKMHDMLNEQIVLKKY
jgi:hypothetical protein